MKLGILSDIHSNPFALRAVLKDIESFEVESILNAGDTFGYYPWAQETFDILKPLNMQSIIGNHDKLVLRTLESSEPNNSTERLAYQEAAAQNADDLSSAGRQWLRELPDQLQIDVEPWKIKLVHGTPDDPSNGRFYPDNETIYPWFPAKGEILIMGHTHYPILRRFEGGGILLNPGSVGQPRDGDLWPGWIFLDTDRLDAPDGLPEIRRVEYDRFQPMELLEKQGWPGRFIKALNKTSPGPMDRELLYDD